MIPSSPASSGSVSSVVKGAIIFLLVISVISLSGCGSTKVYTANKTLVYSGDIYNLATVQRVGSRVEATLPNGDVIDPRQMDKKEFNAMLKENQSVVVASIVELDQQEFVYQRSRVSKYSGYTKIMKNHDAAMDNIRKFMADKKKTQYTLK